MPKTIGLVRFGVAFTLFGLSIPQLPAQTRDASELRARPGAVTEGSQVSKKKPASRSGRMVPVVVRLDVPSVAAVGAENRFGNRGEAVFFNGTGSAPTLTNTTGYEVIVLSSPGAPGETHTVTFTAKGVKHGEWKNCAEMESAFTFGTTIACVEGEVTRREH